MAQGDIKAAVDIFVGANSTVRVQPPSGENWTVKAASLTKSGGSGIGVTVGLTDGSNNQQLVSADGVAIGPGVSNAIDSVQINNNIHLLAESTSDFNGDFGYSAIQHK